MLSCKRPWQCTGLVTSSAGHLAGRTFVSVNTNTPRPYCLAWKPIYFPQHGLELLELQIGWSHFEQRCQHACAVRAVPSWEPPLESEPIGPAMASPSLEDALIGNKWAHCINKTLAPTSLWEPELLMRGKHRHAAKLNYSPMPLRLENRLQAFANGTLVHACGTLHYSRRDSRGGTNP